MTAVIRGDAALAASIRGELSTRGFAANTKKDCPSTSVTVRSAGDGVILEFVDSDGRIGRRRAADAASATNLVDAWVRQGLEMPTETPEAPNAVQKATIAAVSPVAAMGLGAVLGAGFDGSLWFGGTLPISIFVGKVTFGPALSVAADPHLSGESHQTTSSRLLTDLTLFFEYPISLHRLQLRPGASLGASFLAVRRAAEITLSANGNETDSDDAGEHRVTTMGYTKKRETGLVLGLRVNLAVPLKRMFQFVCGLSLNFYPITDTGRSVDSATSLTLSGGVLGAVFINFGLEYLI